MNIMSELALAAMPNFRNIPPEEHRRNKLINALKEQRGIAEAAEKGTEFSVTRRKWVNNAEGGKSLATVPKRLKKWWFVDQNGCCYFAVRYGNKAIEFDKGKTAIDLSP